MKNCPSIAIIAAYAKNRVIGNKKTIPWDLPGDRLHFKQLTMGNTVIFGRTTFEEFGRALPGRTNIVVSSTKDFSEAGALTVSTLSDAIDIGKANGCKKIFLCGGQRIYKEGLSLADEIFITEIAAEFEGDAFFPEIDEGTFEAFERKQITDNGYKLEFISYRRLGSK